MTDLDFDEIDRAVNSAATPNNTNTANDKTTSPSETQPDKPKTPDIGASKPPLAGRRSLGQFMDVVHPSSNMRKPTIVMPERPTQQKPEVSTEKPVEQTAVEDKPAETTVEQPENQWPDPIDVSEPKAEAVEKPEETVTKVDEDDDIDKINQEITAELDKKSSDSMPETPFIQGTTVEKRPLGAFSDESPQNDEEKTSEPDGPNDNQETDSDAKAEVTAETIPSDGEPMSEEIEEELVKIESDDAAKAVESGADTPDLAQEKHIEPAEEKKTPEPEPKHPIEATSINQQYKEQSSTGDQSSGAIYDTEAYHKALIHPPKKKSGWMWVVWILLLLVAGGLAGMVIFYYVLPLL